MQTFENTNAQRQIGAVFLETNKTSTTIKPLNDLIAMNRGMIKVYETAAERLKNPDNIRLLRNYAEQCERFIKELSNLVVSFHGQPVTESTASSQTKQAWITLKAYVTVGDGPIMAEVAQDTLKLLAAYREAKVKTLPEEARQLLRSHFGEIRLTHKKLSTLSVAYIN